MIDYLPPELWLNPAAASGYYDSAIVPVTNTGGLPARVMGNRSSRVALLISRNYPGVTALWFGSSGISGEPQYVSFDEQSGILTWHDLRSLITLDIYADCTIGNDSVITEIFAIPKPCPIIIPTG